MNTEKKSFTFQLFVMAGFLFFFYMFFALATSIYRDYKLETEIDNFQAEIDELAALANEKPKELMYLNSSQYKDLYGKETLNLQNPGEVVIIVPKEDQNIEQGPVELTPEFFSPDSVLNQPNPVQWKEYFFGQTLSVVEPSVETKKTPEKESDEKPEPAES